MASLVYYAVYVRWYSCLSGRVLYSLCFYYWTSLLSSMTT